MGTVENMLLVAPLMAAVGSVLGGTGVGVAGVDGVGDGAVVATTAVEFVVVAVAAVLTATLSALAGLGGGVVLLGVLAQFHAPAVAIPIHGGIQLVANGSRAIFLVKDVHWKAVGRASILLLPASLVGVVVSTSIPEAAGRVALALFALVFAWRPQVLKWRGDQLPLNALIGVGAASGFINTTVGASGPVTSPFFRAVTATHVAFVATAAASQVLAHLAKIVAYVGGGWSPVDHFRLIAVGIVGVTIGSWIGTRLVGRIDEERLGLLFRLTLTALALRLIVTSLVP